jgi:hypothetical protein
LWGRDSSPPTSTTTPAASPPIRSAGAQFGYTLLWSMVPITIALVIIQEMSSRMGAVYRQGLERPDPRGVRAARRRSVLMLALFVTNFLQHRRLSSPASASAFELFGRARSTSSCHWPR